MPMPTASTFFFFTFLFAHELFMSAAKVTRNALMSPKIPKILGGMPPDPPRWPLRGLCIIHRNPCGMAVQSRKAASGPGVCVCVCRYHLVCGGLPCAGKSPVEFTPSRSGGQDVASCVLPVVLRVGVALCPSLSVLGLRPECTVSISSPLFQR